MADSVEYSINRPDRYAPIGVFFDQTNQAGEFTPEAYNSNREKIQVDQIERGQKCMCIVEFGQIWFIDNKFGVTIRLSQVLCEESAKLPSFAFQGLTNNDDEYVEEIMNDLIDE